MYNFVQVSWLHLTFPSFHCLSVCALVFVMHAGNSNNLFSIERDTGLVTRGLRALDRETSSSHMLEVEAYNSDEGSMRSSVRVRSRETTSDEKYIICAL